MLNRFSTPFTLCLLLFATLASAQGQRGGGAAAGRPEAIPSIADRTGGMKKIDGFFPLYWDEAGGRLFVEVPKLDTEVLHSTGFGTGLGSNDIGIDRGALTGSRIVKFERVGPRLLMVQPNYQYRGTSSNAAEVKDVNDAFARSVLWAFQIAAASDGRVLVDFTEFLVRDANDIAGRLQPGSYRFEAGRSTVYMPMTSGFPKNSEMEAELTFVRQPGGPAGGGRGGGGRGGGGFLEGVGSVAATAEAASIRVHHSFVELPDANYKPRAQDPRAGYFGVSYEDFAAPLGERMTKQFIAAAPAEEEGPEGRGQRGGGADRLLRRSRRAGADPIGARRRRGLVEPGVRGGRLPQRLSGRDAARRRRPDRHPLQRRSTGCTDRRAAGATAAA